MLDLPESLDLPGACLRGFSASLAILPTPVKRENTFRKHSSVARWLSSSRNSAHTEKREGRCLRSPCRSGPCTGDQQLGFWGASTRLPEEPRAVVNKREGTSSSPTACQGKLELRNYGWEGMIVSSSLCFMFYMFQ